MGDAVSSALRFATDIVEADHIGTLDEWRRRQRLAEFFGLAHTAARGGGRFAVFVGRDADRRASVWADATVAATGHTVTTWYTDQYGMQEREQSYAEPPIAASPAPPAPGPESSAGS